MALAVKLAELFEAHLDRRLTVSLATSAHDIRAAQQLRYRVFVEELGARMHLDCPGIESDRFDPYCRHLLVRDESTNEVVGCYRILTDTAAQLAGGFYSQAEFDITRVLALPGRILEIGRSCVHPDYRTGSTIALLWRGLISFMRHQGFDYMIGCASIPLAAGTEAAVATYRHLAARYLSAEGCRVYPRVGLPACRETLLKPRVPPLISAYLRAGARVCGEPAWDPQFNVADLFLLLRLEALSRRYARHFGVSR